ncbi:YggT family protein [Aeromicrobium sp. CTD01-1L150]|uniref:YggT family protein n=1 Tax=Aeromicrobium sp. CTD01-1L150 TaxID=3341830 RepID=UPI0035C0CB81
MEIAAVGGVIQLVLWIFIIVLLARIVIDWVQVLARTWRPTGLLAVLCEGIYSVTDPPLRAVRGVIPPVRLGGAMLDLSPMILMFGIYLLFIIVGATLA